VSSFLTAHQHTEDHRNQHIQCLKRFEYM